LKVLSQAHAALVRRAIERAQAAGELPAFDPPEIAVQPPSRPDQGDYASPVAMQLTRLVRKPPIQIAEILLRHLPQAEFVGDVTIAPPGFLNFRLNEDWVRQQVETIIAEGDSLASVDVGQGRRAQVEFVSANPTGPLHIGRTRGAVIGDTIARLLEALCYRVEREYYFNNAGRQMEMLGRTLQARYLSALGIDTPVPEDGYRGEYVADIARQLVEEVGESWIGRDWQPFKEYAEKIIFAWIRASLLRLGVKHDVFFNENSLYDDGSVWHTLEALRERGFIYADIAWEGAPPEERAQAEAQGARPAQWFRSTRLGDEKDRVLLKASGEPTYTLPDIAYHVNKLERGFDLLVNILGADHGTQYQTVRRGLEALGYDPAKLYVVIHQMVRIYRDGQLVRGSTRAGDLIPLDDVIDEVGPDPVRYFLLARSPSTDVEFDLNLAIAQNNENPVYYIQNAHVRCAGIFRMAAERGFADDGADLSLLGPDETTFLRQVLKMPEMIRRAVEEMAPHQLAFFALDTARIFHPLYDNVRVFHSEVPEDVARARLRFYRAAKVVFRRLLTLMGMSAPDFM